jgi:hypothetical protein
VAADPDPWDDAETLISVEHGGPTVQVCHLRRQRWRYFARRLRPAAPTQITGRLELDAVPESTAAREFEAATNFGGLDDLAP